jgi:hypothetical protein
VASTTTVGSDSSASVDGPMTQSMRALMTSVIYTVVVIAALYLFYLVLH